MKDLFEVYGKDTEGLKAILSVLATCAQTRMALGCDQTGRYICMCVCVYVCVYRYVSMYVWMYMHIYMYMSCICI